MTETQILLSDKDVSEMLGISKRSVWNLRNKGEIPPPIKVGRRTLWKRKEIEEWAKKK